MIKQQVNNKYLLPHILENQENLNLNRLKSFVGKKITTVNKRPDSNFLELMDWVMHEYGNVLKDNDKLKKFVHNKIIIDGQFLHFCDENNIKIDCILNDSFISWKSDAGFEKFFAQGIFKIQFEDLEFLHCAMWHIGNQHENEIGFFIIVSDKHYNGYIKLRNNFDLWSQERDRSNLNIRVIDGADIPYTKDHSWDDLFLPTDLKEEIKDLVENFLASQKFYYDAKIPWKRGMLLLGPQGNGKSSIIKTIISEYNFKPVTFIDGNNSDTLHEVFSYAEEQSPSLIYIEDLDSLIENNLDVSTFLNLLDGISAKNGLLIVATANNIKKLKANITHRPSRFDRKFEIPLPDINMTKLYLKKWFGNIIPASKYNSLAQVTVKHGLSYAYLKDIYISSTFEALSHNRKIPISKDIDVTLGRIIKDKNLLNNDITINTDKYLK